MKMRKCISKVVVFCLIFTVIVSCFIVPSFAFEGTVNGYQSGMHYIGDITLGLGRTVNGADVYVSNPVDVNSYYGDYTGWHKSTDIIDVNGTTRLELRQEFQSRATGWFDYRLNRLIERNSTDGYYLTEFAINFNDFVARNDVPIISDFAVFPSAGTGAIAFMVDSDYICSRGGDSVVEVDSHTTRSYVLCRYDFTAGEHFNLFQPDIVQVYNIGELGTAFYTGYDVDFGTIIDEISRRDRNFYIREEGYTSVDNAHPVTGEDGAFYVRFLPNRSEFHLTTPMALGEDTGNILLVSISPDGFSDNYAGSGVNLDFDVRQEVVDINLLDWLLDAGDAFLRFEILPGLSFGTLLIVAISVPALLAIFRAIAGG